MRMHVLTIMFAAFNVSVRYLLNPFHLKTPDIKTGQALREYLIIDDDKSESCSIIPILQRISQIADQYPKSNEKEHLRNEIISLISNVTTSTLGISFPSTMPSMPDRVLAGNVYKNPPKFEASVFAFPKTGNILPLHDHPNMEGFIKALKGKLLITTFSLLNSEEEKRFRKENGKEGNEKIKPAKFEGTKILDASNSEVVTLNALSGNIHSIKSIEGVGAFFDILIPGYKQDHEAVPCTFYESNEDDLIVGQVYWLKIVPSNLVPALVSMGPLEISTVNTPD